MAGQVRVPAGHCFYLTVVEVIQLCTLSVPLLAHPQNRLDLVDLTGRWGHPVASMCRLLLARSFDGDITGPESTDSLVLQRGFLITNMTIPENTVTIAALVVESCAGGFFQAGAFAVP